jgi:hypothetical protein
MNPSPAFERRGLIWEVTASAAKLIKTSKIKGFMNENKRGIVPQNDRIEPQMRHDEWVMLPHLIEEDCEKGQDEYVEYVELRDRGVRLSVFRAFVYRVAFVISVAGGLLAVIWLIGVVVQIILEFLFVAVVLYVLFAGVYVFLNVRRRDVSGDESGDIVIENNISAGDGVRNVTIINNVK